VWAARRLDERANLVDYRVPRTLDLPTRLRCVFVENGDAAGPFGAKGAGEGSLVPVSPAVANALARLNRCALSRARADAGARVARPPGSTHP
jgi:CO/xanthine dehydrogenase Mo-binding subunit